MASDSDDSLTSAQTSPEDSSKGQRLILYIPQGAVIVERIGTGENGEPDATASDSAEKSDEPTPEVASAERADSPTVGNPSADANQTKSTDELRLMYQIAQILDVITKRLEQSNQLGTVEQPIRLSEPFADSDHRALSVEDEDFDGEQQTPVQCKEEHHIHWMHTINVSFVALITLLALLPGVLATFFGTNLYSAHRSNFAGAIHKGDLMISRPTPISQLGTDDLILVRQPNTWTLEVRKVKSISMTTGGTSASITSETDKGISSRTTFSNSANTLAHKVTRVIPTFGSIQDALNSIFVRVGVGLFLLTLNVLAHHRRRTRRLRTMQA